MTAFVDCMVCAKRLIDRGNKHVTEAEFTAWATAQGWTITPTRCPHHAKTEGQAVVAQGYADKLTCTLDHDPKPWLVEGGMAVGGRSIPGGGAASGRQSLAPRPEFCTQHSHYWLYDHFTVPDFIEPEPTAPEGASS